MGNNNNNIESTIYVEEQQPKVDAFQLLAYALHPSIVHEQTRRRRAKLESSSPSSSSSSSSSFFPSYSNNHHKDTPTTPPPKIKELATIFQSLSRAQTALKKIDGVAHEAYQFKSGVGTSKSSSHKNKNKMEYEEEEDFDDDDIVKVAGRASRDASRIGCCADGLFACELLDFVDENHNDDRQQQQQQPKKSK